MPEPQKEPIGSYHTDLRLECLNCSLKIQKTILPLNFFSTRALSFCHLQNISNFSHRISLLPLFSVFQFSFSPKSFLSLSPTSRVRRQDCAPSPVKNGPHLVGKIQTQVLFLTPHLSNLTGSVVRRRKVPPRRFRKNRAFTSSENPQTPRYLLSRSLTLSLTSPTHSVVTCRAG